MKLPHISKATIPEAKLLDYLLNPAHPDNGGKAAFFSALGFLPENCNALVMALHELAAKTEVSEIVESPYGTKYVLDGWLAGRDNRRAKTRTIWIIDQGTEIPRLVTAYPAE